MKGSIDGVPFEFDMDSVRVDEAEAVERALSCSFKTWGEQLGEGRVSALRAMIWLIRRRDQPGLRIDDPTLGQIPLASVVIEDEPGTESVDPPVPPGE